MLNAKKTIGLILVLVSGAAVWAIMARNDVQADTDGGPADAVTISLQTDIGPHETQPGYMACEYKFAATYSKRAAPQKRSISVELKDQSPLPVTIRIRENDPFLGMTDNGDGTVTRVFYTKSSSPCESDPPDPLHATIMVGDCEIGTCLPVEIAPPTGPVTAKMEITQ